MQTLYRVRMWEVTEDGELGPTTQVIVQLTDIDGTYFGDTSQNTRPYAHLALLRFLREHGLRFIGSLPDTDPNWSRDYIGSFWVVTEPASS